VKHLLNFVLSSFICQDSSFTLPPPQFPCSHLLTTGIKVSKQYPYWVWQPIKVLPNTQYYPILENIAQYPIPQCQYRSNPILHSWLPRRQTPPPPTFNWRRRRRKKSIGAPPPPPVKITRRAAAERMTSAHGSTWVWTTCPGSLRGTATARSWTHDLSITSLVP